MFAVGDKGPAAGEPYASRARILPSLKSNSPSDVYLGELEQQLLLIVLRLGDEAYANPIGEMLAKAAGRVVSRGAIYTALERLEQKGCLRSRMGDPTDDRGGKPRRYFSLTPSGLKALKATHAAFASLARGLDAVLEQP